MCAFWEAAYFQVPCSSDVSSGKNKTVDRQHEVLKLTEQSHKSNLSFILTS